MPGIGGSGLHGAGWGAEKSAGSIDVDYREAPVNGSEGQGISSTFKFSVILFCSSFCLTPPSHS